MKRLASVLSLFLAATPGMAQLPDDPSYFIDASFRSEVLEVRAWVVIPLRLLDGEGRAHLDLSAAGPKMLDLTVAHSGRTLNVEADSAGRLVVPLMDRSDPSVEVRYRIAASPSDLKQIGYYLFPGHEVGSYWFPGVVAPDGSIARFMDFDVRLTLPDTLTVLTTGGGRESSVLRGSEGGRVESGETTHQFTAEHETGFAVAMGGAHRLVERNSEGLQVLALVPEQDPEPFTGVAEAALDAAEFYRDVYGFFPKSRLGLVPGPMNFSGGFPMPGVFMVHRANLRPEYVEFITAHELGHYYWGLHVLGDRRQLDWLVLGMGIWADQLYLARRNGRTLEQQWHLRGQGGWMEDYLTAQAGNLEQRLGLGPAELAPLEFDYNSLVRHGKGATGVFLQARRLGEEAFLQLQREILVDLRNRPLPVDTFVARVESKGLDDVGDFFRRWVRGDAVIDYVVESVRPVDATEAIEATQYEIVVRRTGTVPYPIDVEVEDGAGRRERFTVRSNVSSDTLHFQGRSPLSVRLDPDGAVPMWSSTNPAVQRLRLHALQRAGRDEPFLQAARAFLDESEDDWVLRESVEKLVRQGRLEQALAMAERHLDEPCVTQNACRAALALIQGAQAADEISLAERLFERHAAAAERAGLGDEVERLR